MTEPRWLSRTGVDLMHRRQIDEHGGLFGLRDENVLESVLARARNRFLYEGASADLARLAASYAYGIATAHPYTDGNKRTAFVAAAAFLYLNGLALERTELEVVETFLGLAVGEVTEDELAGWFRESLRALG